MPGQSPAIYPAAPRAAVVVTVVPLGPDIVVGSRLLARSILEHTAHGRGGVVAADLTDVAYIDAAGLRARCGAEAHPPRRGDLELAGLNADTRTLFELTRLDTLFRIHDRAPEPAP